MQMWFHPWVYHTMVWDCFYFSIEFPLWGDLAFADDSAHSFCEVNAVHVIFLRTFFCSLLSRCVWEPGFYAKRVKHALSVGKIEKLQIRLPLTFTAVLLLTLTLCNVSPLTLSIWNHLPRNPKLVNQPPNQAEWLYITPLVFNCRVIYDHWRLIVLG